MTAIRKAYVDLAEGQVHYRHRVGTGPAIVLLHQTASSSAMWDKVMTRWPGTHSLFALDTPGFGGSFDPEGLPDMARYTAWVAEAIDRLDLGRPHVVGHHTGAAIGLNLAATAPERVASLALIGPALLTQDERAAFAKRLGAPFAPTRSGAYLLMNWEYLRVGGADDDIALLHREMVDMLRAWTARPHAYRAVWNTDAAPLYRAISCPSTALAARDDILFPYLDRLGDLRPDIRRVVLDKGANFEPDLAPEALVSALATHISWAEGLG